MHDEGTGGNTNGGYGIFPLFPLHDCAFTSCPVGLNARKVKRAAASDGLYTLALRMHTLFLYLCYDSGYSWLLYHYLREWNKVGIN
jgi:hypothetical protein